MLCPFCNFEIDANAVACKNCSATLMTLRSPAGVVAGWIGMVVAIMWGLLGIPLAVFPFISYSLKDYPWPAFVACAVIAAGLFWYSKSTRRTQWVRGDM